MQKEKTVVVVVRNRGILASNKGSRCCTAFSLCRKNAMECTVPYLSMRPPKFAKTRSYRGTICQVYTAVRFGIIWAEVNDKGWHNNYVGMYAYIVCLYIERATDKGIDLPGAVVYFNMTTIFKQYYKYLIIFFVNIYQSQRACSNYVAPHIQYV